MARKRCDKGETQWVAPVPRSHDSHQIPAGRATLPPCIPMLRPNVLPSWGASLAPQPHRVCPRVTPLSGRMLRLSHPWGQPRTPHGLLKHGRHSCTPAVGTQGWEGPGSVAGLSQMCKSWWQCHASAVTRSPQASSSISAPQGATPCRGGGGGTELGAGGIPWPPHSGLGAGGRGDDDRDNSAVPRVEHGPAPGEHGTTAPPRGEHGPGVSTAPR